MRAILRGIAGDNASLRGLTGQGEPGLWTLLGGTSREPDSGGRRLLGGSGQVSMAAKDKHVGGVASGVTEREPGPTNEGDPTNFHPVRER